MNAGSTITTRQWITAALSCCITLWLAAPNYWLTNFTKEPASNMPGLLMGPHSPVAVACPSKKTASSARFWTAGKLLQRRAPSSRKATARCRVACARVGSSESWHLQMAQWRASSVRVHWADASSNGRCGSHLELARAHCERHLLWSGTGQAPCVKTHWADVFTLTGRFADGSLRIASPLSQSWTHTT
jgi:hypothetical protein